MPIYSGVHAAIDITVMQTTIYPVPSMTNPDPTTNSLQHAENTTAPELEPLTAEEQALQHQIDRTRLPRHIAIIMDGNGRWARDKGFMDRIRGHEAGSQSVRIAVRACGELGIEALTLYAFSVENWSRPKTEIFALMNLLETFLQEQLEEIRENNVKLVVSGRIEDLPESTQAILNSAIRSSASNTGLTLNLALSYGGRTEIVDAVKKLAADVKAGKLDPDSITPEDISSRLYHPEIPDPDLLIRTSGELRVSNFLLWQVAYTEIYVSPVLWPDFRRTHLYEAILNYQSRERRFGKVLNA